MLTAVFASLKTSSLKALAITLLATLSLVMCTMPTSAAFIGSDLQPGSDLKIDADNTFYDQSKGVSQFIGHVKVSYDDIRILAPRADISLTETGAAKIAYFSDRPVVKRQHPTKGIDELIADELQIDMQQSLFKATGHVQSDMRSVAAAPVRILSDVQQFDNGRRLLTATGGVRVLHKDLVITSNQAVMRLGANNQAERVVFVGNAVLKQGNNIIKSNRLTILVGTENLLAEGNVRSFVSVPGKNGKAGSTIQMNSDYQQFDRSGNTILASGNVAIDYETYQVRGPKATIRLKPGGQMDVDNMLLTGRPTIVDSERSVTADRILVTTNPRRFDARGNVKTKFKTQPQAPAKPTPAKTGPGTLKAPDKPDSQKPAPILTEEEELGI